MEGSFWTSTGAGMLTWSDAVDFAIDLDARSQGYRVFRPAGAAWSGASCPCALTGRLP